jgi:AraC-like DNA-binding protein
MKSNHIIECRGSILVVNAMRLSLFEADMRGKRLSDDIVRVIYKMRDDGMPLRQIATDVGLSLKAVHNALQRRVGDSNYQQKVSLGRPRITTHKTDLHIRVTIKRNRFKSCRTLASQMGLSKNTVCRRARESGLHSRVAIRDYFLRRHKSARIQWCKSHLHVNFSSWLFSDESTFEVSDCSSVHRAFVRRRPSEKYSPCCVASGPVSNRAKIMVWGCISSYGDSCLAFIEGNVNAERYSFVKRQSLTHDGTYAAFYVC